MGVRFAAQQTRRRDLIQQAVRTSIAERVDDRRPISGIMLVRGNLTMRTVTTP